MRTKPPGERHYGDCLFDGELALIRHDAERNLVQASIKSGSVLGQGGQLILCAPNPVDYLTARWNGDTVTIECPSSESLQLRSQDARKALHDGKPLAASHKDGVLTIAATPAQAAPRLTNASVKLEPPQPGLHGAQPWATVTWRTKTAATTQVQFWTDDGLIRRTSLDTRLVTAHRASSPSRKSFVARRRDFGRRTAIRDRGKKRVRRRRRSAALGPEQNSTSLTGCWGRVPASRETLPVQSHLIGRIGPPRGVDGGVAVRGRG